MCWKMARLERREEIFHDGDCERMLWLCAKDSGFLGEESYFITPMVLINQQLHDVMLRINSLAWRHHQ